MSDVRQRTLAIFRKAVDEKSKGGEPLSDDALMGLTIAALRFDSLEKMELVMEIEDAFNVSLDEGDVMACVTVSDLVTLVERNA